MRKNKKTVQFLFIALAACILSACTRATPTTIPDPIARCEKLQKNLRANWQAIEKSTRELEGLSSSLDQLEQEKAQGKSEKLLNKRFAALQEQYEKTISDSVATENRVRALVNADLQEIATLKSFFLALKSDKSRDTLRRNARIGLSEAEIDEALKDLDQSRLMAEQLNKSLSE